MTEEEKNMVWDVIKALKAKPCEDCVSREFMYKLGAKCIAARDKDGELIAITSIESLPSVTPKQPFINKPCVSSEVCEHDKQKVLDEIKAELEKLDGMYVLRDRVFYAEKDPKHAGFWYVRLKDVLDILDKYKEGESE